MDRYDDFTRNGRNYRSGEEPEYYEDTHDDSGRYISSDARRSMQGADRSGRGFSQRDGFSSAPEQRRGFSREQEPRRDFSRESERMRGYAPDGGVRRPEEDTQPQYTDRNGEKTVYGGPSPLPDKSGYIAPRFYQNVVVYEPSMPEDVHTRLFERRGIRARRQRTSHSG